MNEKTRCINLFTRTDLAYDDYEHYNGNELEDFVNTNYQLFDVDVNKNEVGKTLLVTAFFSCTQASICTASSANFLTSCFIVEIVNRSLG